MLQEERSRDETGNDFLEIESTTITEFFRRKAEVELNENKERREKCLEELKSMILNKGDVWKPNLEDDFLLRFLRTRKFNTSRAFALLKNYYTLRKQHPDLFEDFSPSYVTHAMKQNVVNFLPYRTSSGCIIWYTRIGNWNPDIVSFNDMFKFGMMCLEKAMDNPITQICGVVNIVDLEGFSWKHLLSLTPWRMRYFIAANQDAFPLRQKEVHMVNNPQFFQLLFAVIHPFLNAKMRSRIYFHGRNMNSLHQHVPADLLPEEVGGRLGPFQNDRFYESLLQSEETFVNNQKFGYRVP